MDLAHNIELILKPWGRIEGTLRVGATRGRGLPLLINGGPRWRLRTWPFRGSRTRQRPILRAGLSSIAWARSLAVAQKIELSEHPYSSANTTEIEIKPGQTVKVTIGGTGRPVIGRVVVPEGLRQRLDWGYSLNQPRHKQSIWNQAVARLGMGGGRGRGATML